MKTLLILLVMTLSFTGNAQAQKTTDSAQWAQMRTMVDQMKAVIATQKTTDSLQWAYMSLIIHKTLPQYVERFAWDSLMEALKNNAPWGFPTYGTGVVIPDNAAFKWINYEYKDTDMTHCLIYYKKEDVYICAYYDEPIDVLWFLCDWHDGSGYEGIAIRAVMSQAKRFKRKEDAVAYINRHAQDIREDRKNNARKAQKQL